MSFEINVSGFSQKQFENAHDQLNSVSERLGVPLLFSWDHERQQIRVIGEERIKDASVTDEILDAIETAILGDEVNATRNSATWNKERNWWDCEELVLDGTSIQVCIDSPIDGASELGLKTASIIRKKLKEFHGDWRRFASSVLLESYNKSWAVNSESLAGNDFQSQLVIESICIDDDGGYSVYFEASNLYPGHCVVIDVDETQSPFQARLG